MPQESIQTRIQALLPQFSPLFKKIQEDGHITDQYLQELGFPVDVDSYGREVHRAATIAQEYM